MKCQNGYPNWESWRLNKMSYVTTTNTVNGTDVLSSDEINRTARIAHMVFISLDYCILYDYLRLKDKGKCTNSRNPYKLDYRDITNLVKTSDNSNDFSRNDDYSKITKPKSTPSDKSSPNDNSQKKNNESAQMGNEKDEIESTFRDYNIWLLLQKMLSYILLNPQKLYQLQIVNLTDSLKSGDLYGTTDVEDKDVTNYVKELRERKILEELENANSGAPPVNAAEEIILETIQSLGSLTDENRKSHSLESVSNSTNEISKENEIIKVILSGGLTKQNTVSITAMEMIKLIGLEKVHQRFTSYLPTSACDILNTSLFDNILAYWGNLFLSNKSETMEMLVASYPRISERFINSVTQSEKQIDNRHYAVKLVQKFVGNAVISQRERELSDLSRYPTAASALIAFRSLRVIDLKSLSPTKLWNVSEEQTGRLDYLYVIWWILTPEKELNVLFDFILNFSFVGKDNIIKKDDVNAAAMFPGNLETVGSYTSSSNIRVFLENEKRRFKTKIDSMRRPDDFTKIKLEDNVGYEI